MKNIIKKIILKVFNYLGFNLRGNKPTVSHNNYDAIHKFLITQILKCEEPVIFDVGANDGESIKRFKKILPNSKIYSFEPDDKIFKRLKDKYSKTKNVYLNNIGLSNKDGSQKFYSYAYDKINSLIPLDKNSKLYKSRKIARNNIDKFEEEKIVKLLKLDSFSNEKKLSKINILKIDVQGHEPEVIEGAKKFIEKNNIDLIEMEIILGFGYDKSISFYDVEKHLHQYGYKLAAINYDSNIVAFSNYQVDVIYVKNLIFDEIKKLHHKNITLKDITKKTDKSHPYSN